jgi:hypothetical protein
MHTNSGLAPFRGTAAAALAAVCLAFAHLPASGCLVQYDWAPTELSASVSISLSTDATLPIQKQIKSLEVVMNPGTIEERRQEYAQLFADFDQKTNQLFTIMSEMMRQERDMHATIVRNMLFAAADGSGGVAAQAPSSYSLIFSFADLPDFVLPLECSAACEGSAQSAWGFVRYVPEPAPLTLLLASGVAFGLFRARGKS